ncbi:MAG: hypothetical protein WCX90_05345 [Thiohalomonadaceae bacterium]
MSKTKTTRLSEKGKQKQASALASGTLMNTDSELIVNALQRPKYLRTTQC